jgi:hypothetical protein
MLMHVCVFDYIDQVCIVTDRSMSENHDHFFAPEIPQFFD